MFDLGEPLRRCPWAIENTLILEYHDREWGVPEHDDRKLYELLVLEGAQAGLSWETVLRKRENYRVAFDDFNYELVMEYTDADVDRLVSDPGIIRNRLKISAAIENARQVQKLVKEVGSFDQYIWRFVDRSPIKNVFRSLSELPSKTAISERMSKKLRARGFKFVGPTICYAFMQAVGMVNDHLVDCFRYEEV